MKWLNSIAFRFWLTINILILLVVLITSGLNIWKESNHLEDLLKSEAGMIANTLGTAIGLNMLEGDYSEISPLAYSLVDQPEVKYVTIRDTAGNIVSQKGETLDHSEAILVETVPIHYFQKNIGEIEIGVRTERLKEQKEALFRSTIFTAFITSLASLFLSFWVSRHLTLPLQKLVDATKEMTKGNRSVSVPEEQITEINELVTAFNQMSRTIEDFERNLVKEINRATKSLSDKVKTLEVMSNIARSAIEKDLSKKEVIRVALREITQYIYVDKISVALWNEGNREEVLIVTLVHNQLLKEEMISLEDTPIKQIFEEKRLVKRNHLEATELLPREKILLEDGIKSTVMLPLIAKDKVLGSLNLGSSQEDFYQKVSISEVVMFANQTAIALDRAALYMSLRKAAYYDYLTGLANNRLLKEKIDEVIERRRRENEKFAVLFLDLDRFKNINDTLGHEIGDLILKEVSKLLLGNLSYEYTISRMGGDEFIIIIPYVDEIEDAIECAKKINALLNKPIRVKEYELHITGSIGIAMFPNDGADADTLIKHADTAMYRVKDQGRNNFAVYSPLKSDLSYEKLVLENDLRKALLKKEFVVHYQPKINIFEGTISGFEALVRWNHSERGMISPGSFIPAAEETGLIVQIGEHVMKEAAKQMVKWMKVGLPEVPVAVNLSTRQFLQSNLVNTVESVLKETGLPPHLLELEITESMTIDIDRSVEVLTNLKNLGVRISIDDFGTGYSSLHYLQQLPIDRLKIDQSFVQNITLNESHEELVSTIIQMAKNLKLSVTAEGVETETQAQFLQLQSCEEVQGYYFSKPLSAEEIEERFSKLIEKVRYWKVD